MTVTEPRAIPGLSLRTAHTGASSKPNELGMREMQRNAYAHRGEQYLLIKSPPASGKSRALMFIALDKLHNQGVTQAIVVVPERSIGGSFADEPFSATHRVTMRICNRPIGANARARSSSPRGGALTGGAVPAGLIAPPSPIRSYSRSTRHRSAAANRLRRNAAA